MSMTPWVKRLLLLNVVVFLFTANNPFVGQIFGFTPALVIQKPWSVVTYMFIHAGFMHIFFNMLALYFFGPRLEARLGGKRFVQLYFLSGLGGALLSIGTPYVTIVGASGAVFGVMFGFAKFWPNEPVYLWFVLPIPVRVLVIFLTALSLWGGISGARDNVAHFAHLGGFVAAWIFLKVVEKKSPARKFREKAQGTAKASAAVPSANLNRWRSISSEGLHPLNKQELDRILDKISQSGVEALSLEERQFLDRFSAI